MNPLSRDEAVSVSVKDHVHNFERKFLDMPKWQRNGQKNWEGNYLSELIDSIMSGIDLPKLYFALILGKQKRTIIDGGHRTRALVRYKNNEFAWVCGNVSIFYSQNVIDGENYRVMTDEERDYFDNYSLTVVCYKDITEKQARKIFNRLQNSAPMTMPDIVNSYESDLVEFFRNIVRSLLLNGKKDYKHFHKSFLKHPDTNMDLYQFLSLFTIINPIENKDKQNTMLSLENIELGKTRNGNKCFQYLQMYDDDCLTKQVKDKFIEIMKGLCEFLHEYKDLFTSGLSGDIPTYLHATLYVNDFSKDKFILLINDIIRFANYDKQYQTLSKGGNIEQAKSMQTNKQTLDSKYNGGLSMWLKSRQQNPASYKHMHIRYEIVNTYCSGTETNSGYHSGHVLKKLLPLDDS